MSAVSAVTTGTPHGSLAPPIEALSSSAFRLSFFNCLGQWLFLSNLSYLVSWIVMNGGAIFNNLWFVKCQSLYTSTFFTYKSIVALLRSPCTQFGIAYGGLDGVLCSFNISISLNTGGGARWGKVEITGDQCNYGVYQEQCCIRDIQKVIHQPPYTAPLLL